MNSQLKDQNKEYQIPNDILNIINSKLIISTPKAMGYRRAKDLLKNKTLNYGTLKLIKNFFDYCDPISQKDEFELVGGNAMQSFVERTLKSEREKINLMDKNKVVSAPPSASDNTLKGSDGNVDMSLELNESKNKKTTGSAVVIINEENKILVVKRSPVRSTWNPNKWALVGGKIEKNEEPIDAAKREVSEECGLKITHFIDSFYMLSPPNNVDYFFIAKAPKNQEVKLNEEHTECKWLSLNEIKKLDAVPMLYESVELALLKINNKK
jgi:dATP pyrophosphohydrolase